MQVIGLSGGTGTGKGFVGQYLLEKGAVIIDADTIGHKIIEKGTPAYAEIVSYYGESILDEAGQIVRKRLGEIVFQDKEKLAFLNRCTHKHIADEIIRLVEDEKKKAVAKAVVIDAPLLFEAGLARICDKIWIVEAELEKRIARIMARDGISEEIARARILSQKTPQEYAKSANVIIQNNGDSAMVEKQIDALL